MARPELIYGQLFVTGNTLQVVALQQTPPSHALVPPQSTVQSAPEQVILPLQDEVPLHSMWQRWAVQSIGMSQLLVPPQIT